MSNITDSTDNRMCDLTEGAYNSMKFSNEAKNLTTMLSSVRNFGNSGTMIQSLSSSGEGAVFKDYTVLDGSLATKHYYDRSSELLKCDPSVFWEDFVKVQRTDVAQPEAGPAPGSLTSTIGACKFIKDEKEPTVIMDAPCPNFDQSPEMSTMDNCCDTYRRQQQQPQEPSGHGEGALTSFRPVTAAARSAMEGSPNFLLDLNQSEQLPVLSQARSDSRCGSTGTMYRNEVTPRWQASLPEPNYWGQSTGLTEDTFLQSSYDAIQSQALVPRKPSSPFPSFPG